MSQFIEIPESKAIALWNNFAASHQDTVPYSFNPSLFYFFKQHFNWHPCFFLLYDEHDEIIGLFPLVNTGKARVSLPHFSYGGILTTNRHHLYNSDFIDTVIHRADKSGIAAGFYKLTVGNQPSPRAGNPAKLFIRSFNNQHDKRFVKSEKATYVLALDEQEKLFAALNHNLRRKINKASKSGFTVKAGGHELADDFYRVYSKNIDYLNSINYSRQFFNDLLSAYDFGGIRYFVVYRDNKPVASALLAGYNGFYENLYFATLHSVRRFYVSDWLHWQMINYCIGDVIKHNGDLSRSVYSFGRSTEFSSVHNYKIHWPVTVIPLYLYSSVNEIKQNSVLKKIWQYLPRFLKHLVGSTLIKHIY